MEDSKPETKFEEIGEQPRMVVKTDKGWVKCCEVCKKPLPAYPLLGIAEGQGLVSPESDKMRATHVLGVPAIQALEKTVCLDCYREAFKRVYPDGECPV